MKEKNNFSKCPHYNEKTCPGENLVNIGRAVSTKVVYFEKGKFIGGDLLDFTEEHNCDKCPKNKHAFFTHEGNSLDGKSVNQSLECI